jgi:thioredoxin reductase
VTSEAGPNQVDLDILIVGAGPAGLYAAYYAGFRGLSVAVMDIITGGIGTFTPRPLPAGREFEGRGLVYFVPRPDECRDRDHRDKSVPGVRRRRHHRLPGKVRLIAVGFGEAATAVTNAASALDPAAPLFPGHSTDAA